MHISLVTLVHNNINTNRVSVSRQASILDNTVFNARYKQSIKEATKSIKLQPLREVSGLHSFTTTSKTIVLIKNEVIATGRRFGLMWRSIFRCILVWSADLVNALRISRPLQIQIDYLQPHEAVVLGEVITALNDIVTKRKDVKENLKVALEGAFKLRNVGRVVVQNASLRSSGPFDVWYHLYFQLQHIRSFAFVSMFTPVSFPPATEIFV